MTENWVVIAACFTSSILSSMTAWAITWGLASKKIDHLRREVNVYKAAIRSKEGYVSDVDLKNARYQKALNDIQEVLYGVPK